MEYTTEYKSKVYFVGSQHKSNSTGTFRVLGRVKGSYIKFVVRFDMTGTKLVVQQGNIKAGFVKDKNFKTVLDVGCIGYGKFKSKDNGASTKLYTVWFAMLSRVYNPDNKQYKYYKDCSVSEDWLNFQNYARDITDMDGFDSWIKDTSRRYNIDKDESGTKEYSKETCKILTCTENQEERLKQKLDITFYALSPEGVKYEFVNRTRFAQEHNLHPRNWRKVCNGDLKKHRGWTLCTG